MKTLFLNGYLVGPGFIVFAGAHLSWFYLRLICLPRILYVISDSLEFKEQVEHLAPYKPLIMTLLATLIIMHFFWYYLLLSATITALVSGKKIKDNQNDLLKKE